MLLVLHFKFFNSLHFQGILTIQQKNLAVFLIFSVLIFFSFVVDSHETLQEVGIYLSHLKLGSNNYPKHCGRFRILPTTKKRWLII